MHMLRERKGSYGLRQTLHFCTNLCALTVEEASSTAFQYLHTSAVNTWKLESFVLQ